MLSDNGISPMHPSVIAKIEAGTRSVRINEGFAIAELFGLSLDALLGRATDPQADQAYAVRSLLDSAHQSSYQVWGIAAALGERFQDVASLEFEGRESLQADGKRAFDALNEAIAALRSIALFALPGEEASLRPYDRETAIKAASKSIAWQAALEVSARHGTKGSQG